MADCRATKDMNLEIKNDIIQYQVFKERRKTKEREQLNSEVTVFNMVLSAVTGLLVQFFVYALLGIGVKDVPAIAMISLWFVISVSTAWILNRLGY